MKVSSTLHISAEDCE